MSTIKVTAIQHENTSNGGIQLDNAGHVTVDGQQMPTAGALSNRNKCQNGDMRIDQRNAGAAISSNAVGGNWAVDRTQAYGTVVGRFSCQQNQGSVTPPAGFSNYLGITALSNTAPGTNEPNLLQQSIEGFDISDLNWGTANAKPVMVSFWVRANNTGNYGIGLRNGAVDFHYATTYTIDNANTWEHKTVPFPGPTAGTWYTDNRPGILLDFDLGSGSFYNSPSPNTWNSDGIADEKYTVSGVEKTVGTAGRYLYLTGLQLEVGEKPTPFEHRSFSDELARCCRYYQKSYSYEDAPGTVTSGNRGNDFTYLEGGNTGAHINIKFNPEMRVTPNVTTYSIQNANTVGVLTASSTDYATGTNASVNSAKNFLVFAGGVTAADDIYAAWTAFAEM